MNAATDVNKTAIETQAEFGHGIGFVDICGREEFRAQSAEDFLRSHEEVAVVFATSGHVEQTNQDALGADSDGVVEISGDPFAYKHSSNVGAIDFREDRWDRFYWRRFAVLHMKRRKHAIGT